MESSALSNRFLEQLLGFDPAVGESNPRVQPTALLDRPRKLALEYIQERTRPGNITSTGLASIEDFDLDSAALRSLDYRVLLQELRDAGHIFVYPAYRYAAEARGGLEPVRYLVARPEPLELLYEIFGELVQASINTILAWLSALEAPADAILHLLEAKSGADETPVVFSPGRTLQAFRKSDRSGLAPDEWLVQEFIRRIRDELGAKSAAVLLPGDRFVPLGEAHTLSCFRVCAGYLQKHADRIARRDSEFATKIEAILREEQSYARKPYSGPVLDYDIRRATAVHAAADPQEPGLELAARMILALRSRATELQKREWQEYCARFVADFLRGLQKDGSDWTGRIRFFTMRSRSEVHPAIWPLLRHHPALISERWETESGTCFLFCSRRPEHLGALLEGVARDLSCEGWKLQAIAKLLEQNEHFELLMESPARKRLRAQLIRRATRETIPAPVRWLLFLPSFLHRIPEEMSRSRIASQQAELGAKNRLRQSRATPLESQADSPGGRAENPRRKAASFEQFKVQLSNLLEDEYFTEGRIATIGGLHRSFPELKAGEFARLLRGHGFQLLPADLTEPSRITRGSIVLFADDASLPVYLGRVRDLVGRLLSAKATGKTGAGENEKFEFERQRKLAAILNDYLTKKSSTQSGIKSGRA